MMADLKNVQQDEQGRYIHKAIFYGKDKSVFIGATYIFEEAGGCWSCTTDIFFEDKTFVLDGMHPKHKVLIYKESA